MTCVIIPDGVMKLMTAEVSKIVADHVKKLCEIYDLDYDEAMGHLDLKINLDIKEDYKIVKKRVSKLKPEERCIALLKGADEIKQCDFKKADGKEFCKNHDRMHTSNRLAFGTIKDPLEQEIDHTDKRKIY